VFSLALSVLFGGEAGLGLEEFVEEGDVVEAEAVGYDFDLCVGNECGCYFS